MGLVGMEAVALVRLQLLRLVEAPPVGILVGCSVRLVGLAGLVAMGRLVGMVALLGLGRLGRLVAVVGLERLE